jgi:IS605 OrfB family transposase
MICREYVTRRKQFKKRKLRWRSRKSLGWVPFRKDCIKFDDGKIVFNKQTYRVFQPERLPEKGTYKCGEFSQDARKRWYICIPVEHSVKPVHAVGEVGIDLGLKDLASLSNGKKVSGGRYYRMMERRLARAQRGKKRKQARGIHAKIRNKRFDDLHKASTQIVEENKLIVVGKLPAKRLAKTKMAKSINDAATTAFKTMLRYKASAQQHQYIEVCEDFSTQICSSCESIPASAPKGVKDLGVREWVCSNCGAVHDRDTNAALNILRFGRESLVS